MKTMSHRTTFALDKDTAGRLKRLAGVWHVSQAEVVRRAVAMAEDAAYESEDPSASLRALHQSGKGLVREKAEEYMGEVSSNRKMWRGSD